MGKKYFYTCVLVFSFLLAGIQPTLATKSIPSDKSIGTWDGVSRTYTLTTDVYEGIQIDEDNLTLDGAGHTVAGTGWGSGYGVYLLGRMGVTVEQVNIRGFKYGIGLWRSCNNTLMANTANLNADIGIYLGHDSDNNTLTYNTANSNDYDGILLSYSSNNTISNNTVSNNRHGISLQHSHNNTLRRNTIASNDYYCGLDVFYSSGNQIYNNNFVDNRRQVNVYAGSGNVFNLDRPIGGNYWSNWTSPDDDGDGFVDYPYTFTGGQDNLPWARADGWLVVLVEIDIKPGSYPNAINLGSHGLIPVAILSSEDFDATTVDPDTVELGGAGVEVRGKSNKYMAHQEDVNGDELIDLVVQVATQNLDPESFQDGYAVLTGKTYDGVPIEGQDQITIVPLE